MSGEVEISVFLPVYNEEKILGSNLTKVYQALSELNCKFEIVVVDDASTDKTSEVVAKLEKKIPELRHLRYETGPTRRENLAKAFRTAKGKIIIFMDADLATDLKHLPQLIEEIKAGNDIVVGSRYMGIKAKRVFTRRIISFLYNSFINLYFNSKIHDHQCGFKAFRREILFPLLQEMGYDENLVRGWFWDAELLIRAQRKKLKIKEIPVNWEYGDKTSFILARELRMLPYVLKLRWKL